MLDDGWRRELAFTDLLQIDLATLGAAGRLCETGPRRKVIAPCSIATLTSSRGRIGMMARLGREGHPAAESLIVDLLGICEGAPVGQALEAAAVLRDRCQAVVMRTQPTRPCFQALRETALPGISLDAAKLPQDPVRLKASLWSVSQAARRTTRLRMVLGLPDMAALQLAEDAGFTHASVRGEAEPGQAACAEAETRAG